MGRLVAMSVKCNAEVKMAIAECLGEIGPVNLNTVALIPVCESMALQRARDVFKADTYLQNYCTIYHVLDSYLTDQE